MARTYTSANLRCARPDCNSKSVYRVVCYECERCFHTSCVNLEDKDFGTFLCTECNEAIIGDEENACCLSISEKKSKGAISQEQKNSDNHEPCTNPRCEIKGRCYCQRSYQEWSKQDKDINSCEILSVPNDSDEDEKIDPLREDSREVQVRTPCANKPCGMRGKYRVVCLSCGKFYHHGCIQITYRDHRLFWCDDCCYPPVPKTLFSFKIFYLDISTVASKIDQIFNKSLNVQRKRSGNGEHSRPDGQGSTSDAQVSRPGLPDTRPETQGSIPSDQDSRPEAQGSRPGDQNARFPGQYHINPDQDLDPEILELLNYDPFINDPDLVGYDPVLAANSYNPSLGPRPSTIEELRAWRDGVREAEREIQLAEIRMQKARVIDRGFNGTFQEELNQEILNEYRSTPCDAQFCAFRGMYHVMCIKCQRMFHTGCLSLPDYDYETTVCFYCPLPDTESDNDDDDESDDFFLELDLA